MQATANKQLRIKEALSGGNGSENLYNFKLSGNIYTDGVLEMSKLCSASWLVTDSLIMCKHLAKRNPFIVVKFKYTPKLKDRKIQAKVKYEDGNGSVLHSVSIMETDFPLESFEMFYENNTLYLPSER